MKKTVLIFIVAALVVVTTAVWIITSRAAFKPADLGMYAVLILVVGFALFIGVKRLSSVKKGEPAEDELSKKVLQKTAAMSYYISLYLWLAVMYVSDKKDYETSCLSDSRYPGDGGDLCILLAGVQFQRSTQ